MYLCEPSLCDSDWWLFRRNTDTLIPAEKNDGMFDFYLLDWFNIVMCLGAV